MRKVKNFKGDSIQIEAIDFHMSGGAPAFVVDAAIVDTDNDGAVVVGSTRCSTWSEETEKQLKEFLQQLEKDICSQIGSGSRSTRSGILDELRED
jgi:hypothetical protein